MCVDNKQPLSFEDFVATKVRLETSDDLPYIDVDTPFYLYDNTCYINITGDNEYMLELGNWSELGELPDLERKLYLQHYLPEHCSGDYTDGTNAPHCSCGEQGFMPLNLRGTGKWVMCCTQCPIQVIADSSEEAIGNWTAAVTMVQE